MPEYLRLKAAVAVTEQMRENARKSPHPLPVKLKCRDKRCVNRVCIAAEALAEELPGMGFDALRDIVIDYQQFDWYGDRVEVGKLAARADQIARLCVRHCSTSCCLYHLDLDLHQQAQQMCLCAWRSLTGLSCCSAACPSCIKLHQAAQAASSWTG